MAVPAAGASPRRADELTVSSRYYHYAIEHRTACDEEAILAELSPALREEATAQIVEPIVSNVRVLDVDYEGYSARLLPLLQVRGDLSWGPGGSWWLRDLVSRSCTQPVVVLRGAVVVTAGEPGSSMFITQVGVVRAVALGASESTAVVLGPVTALCVRNAFGGVESREVTLRAGPVEVRMLELSGPDFEAAFADAPEVMRQVLSAMRGMAEAWETPGAGVVVGGTRGTVPRGATARDSDRGAADAISGRSSQEVSVQSARSQPGGSSRPAWTPRDTPASRTDDSKVGPRVAPASGAEPPATSARVSQQVAAESARIRLGGRVESQRTMSPRGSDRSMAARAAPAAAATGAGGASARGRPRDAAVSLTEYRDVDVL